MLITRQNLTTAFFYATADNRIRLFNFITAAEFSGATIHKSQALPIIKTNYKNHKQ